MVVIVNEEVKVSVVIPTCNIREIYLKETLQCIFSQSFVPWEIIIVNNGKAELHSIEELSIDGRVKIYNIVHYAGVAQVRNFGACLAEGDYVAFIDDDDLWEKKYLEKVAEIIKKEKPDCVITRLDQIREGKISSYKNADNGLTIDDILIRNPGITGSSVIVRREAFKEVGGYNPKMPTSEDKSLALEMLLRKYKVITAPNIQSIFRQYSGNRLTNAKSMAEGITSFLEKYRTIMNKKQRGVNLAKINYYKYKDTRNPFYLFKTFFFRAILWVLELISKV